MTSGRYLDSFIPQDLMQDNPSSFIRPKTELDTMRATWEKEQIHPFTLTDRNGHYIRGYSPSDVADREGVVKSLEERFDNSSKVIKDNHLSNSRNLEFIIYHNIEQNDWFKEFDREDELMGKDYDGLALRSFPAAKYDDYVHGADLICVINNSTSNFQPVPFVLDATADNRDESIAHHLTRTYKDIYGDRGNSYPGLEGITSITYFEDVTTGNPAYEKGPIPVLPRFVVGFDTYMGLQMSGLDTILRRRPSDPNVTWTNITSRVKEERFEDWGDFADKSESELRRRKEELNLRASWILIHEISLQIDQLCDNLGLIPDIYTGSKTLYKHATSLKKYFDGAKSVVDLQVREVSQRTDESLRRRCEADPVYQAILRELSSETKDYAA